MDPSTSPSSASEPTAPATPDATEAASSEQPPAVSPPADATVPAEGAGTSSATDPVPPAGASSQGIPAEAGSSTEAVGEAETIEPGGIDDAPSANITPDMIPDPIEPSPLRPMADTPVLLPQDGAHDAAEAKALDAAAQEIEEVASELDPSVTASTPPNVPDSASVPSSSASSPEASTPTTSSPTTTDPLVDPTSPPDTTSPDTTTPTAPSASDSASSSDATDSAESTPAPDSVPSVPTPLAAPISEPDAALATTEAGFAGLSVDDKARFETDEGLEDKPAP